MDNVNYYWYVLDCHYCPHETYGEITLNAEEAESRGYEILARCECCDQVHRVDVEPID